jgi:hypothetical protein
MHTFFSSSSSSKDQPTFNTDLVNLSHARTDRCFGSNWMWTQDSAQWKLLKITNPGFFWVHIGSAFSLNHFCDAEYFWKRKFEPERVSAMQSIQIFSAFQTTLTRLRNEIWAKCHFYRQLNKKFALTMFNNIFPTKSDQWRAFFIPFTEICALMGFTREDNVWRLLTSFRILTSKSRQNVSENLSLCWHVEIILSSSQEWELFAANLEIWHVPYLIGGRGGILKPCGRHYHGHCLS